MKKKVNVIRLLQMIIKIIGVVIETFRDSEEIDEVDDTNYTDVVAENLARMSSHVAILTELCRMECQNDEEFNKKYTEVIQDFINRTNTESNVQQEQSV